MRTQGCLGCALAATTVAAARSARSQNLSDDYVAQSGRGAEALVPEETGVAPEPPRITPTRQDFETSGFVCLYGHIDMGPLHVDDGIDSETCIPPDNANSVSRPGVHLERPLDEGWLFSSRVEVGYAPCGGFGVNQHVDELARDFNADNIRRMDFTLSGDRECAPSVGQGPMAFAGVMLVDFSDTGVIAASASEDAAGAPLIRLSDPTALIDAGAIVGAAFADVDGERRVRVRHDRPSRNGPQAGGACGRNILTTDGGQRDEDLFDVSPTDGETFGDFYMGAAGGGLERGPGPYSADGDVKLGRARDLSRVGETAVSLHYHAGDDIVGDSHHRRSLSFAAIQVVKSINSQSGMHTGSTADVK